MYWCSSTKECRTTDRTPSGFLMLIQQKKCHWYKNLLLIQKNNTKTKKTTPVWTPRGIFKEVSRLVQQFAHRRRDHWHSGDIHLQEIKNTATFPDIQLLPQFISIHWKPSTEGKDGCMSLKPA
jgi:hypothetical protein